MFRKKFIFLFFAVCAPLLSSEPGVLILRSSQLVDGLNKQGMWLEKYLPKSIRSKSIDRFDYQITKSDENENVIFLTSLVFPYKTRSAHSSRRGIRCLQSMFEASKIPKKWVERMNREFDFVTVPNEFCLEVYTKCGVKIPIFVLTMGSFLENWLDETTQIQRQKPFVFIASGHLWTPAKNHDLLIKAFIEAFGDSDEVLLKIQVRAGGRERAEELIAKYNLDHRKNIEFHYGDINEQEYKDLVLSANCLVNISAGEGFSITPREALAVGMPAIVTNNSAQSDICRTGFVRSVECEEIIPANYPMYPGENLGVQWNPSQVAVKEALIDMFCNYERYLDLAAQARPWIAEQAAPLLAPKWTTLLHPKMIVLGDKNEVTDRCLKTSSRELYVKYHRFMKNR